MVQVLDAKTVQNLMHKLMKLFLFAAGEKQW